MYYSIRFMDIRHENDSKTVLYAENMLYTGEYGIF